MYEYEAYLRLYLFISRAGSGDIWLGYYIIDPSVTPAINSKFESFYDCSRYDDTSNDFYDTNQPNRSPDPQ